MLELEAFPAGMELFPAANNEQWAFIQRQIEASDYYLIVIAGRYGSLAAGGISYTEEEYDYAVHIGLPVLAFLSRDVEFTEDSETSRTRLVSFRSKVSKERLFSHFDNENDLKGRVWHALSNAFKQNPRPGWLRARMPKFSDVRLPIRKAVGEILLELAKGNHIIQRLVYVVMAITDDFSAKRYELIVSECDRLKFVAIHFREVNLRVTAPLDTMHDLIGRANLVIFDLSEPDPDVTYQLGVQRGYGEIEEDGVLLVTDHLETPAVAHSPFPIQPFTNVKELQVLIRKSLEKIGTSPTRS